MSPQAFIFIGRSGSGKGTQGELLKKLIEERDPAHSVLYVQTGQEFRAFIQGNSYTQEKSKGLYASGGLFPEFITIHMWSHMISRDYKEGDHLIFDGTPRKFHEAGALDSVFPFYGLPKPFVVYLDVGAAAAKKRLLERKRSDDTEAAIDKRLAWFDTDVVPALEFYRGNAGYRFLEIDGERPVEEIHRDIVKKAGLE